MWFDGWTRFCLLLLIHCMMAQPLSDLAGAAHALTRWESPLASGAVFCVLQLVVLCDGLAYQSLRPIALQIIRSCGWIAIRNSLSGNDWDLPVSLQCHAWNRSWGWLMDRNAGTFQRWQQAPTASTSCGRATANALLRQLAVPPRSHRCLQRRWPVYLLLQ